MREISQNEVNEVGGGIAPIVAVPLAIATFDLALIGVLFATESWAARNFSGSGSSSGGG